MVRLIMKTILLAIVFCVGGAAIGLVYHGWQQTATSTIKPQDDLVWPPYQLEQMAQSLVSRSLTDPDKVTGKEVRLIRGCHFLLDHKITYLEFQGYLDHYQVDCEGEKAVAVFKKVAAQIK